MARREIIDLVCTKCKRKNYSKTRNKKSNVNRIEASKFCPFCRGHVAHKEAK